FRSPGCPPRRIRHVPAGHLAVGERECRRHCALAETLALGVQPLLELRGGGGEEAGEEMAAIQLECFLQTSCLQAFLERNGVAPQSIPIDRDRVAPPAEDHVVTERVAEEI